jgi:Protein of unknown function (DUF2934)
MSNRTTSSTTTTGSTHAGHGTSIPHDRIAMRAYEKWCQRGCPAGTDQDDWYQAEQELKAEMSRGATQQQTTGSAMRGATQQQPQQQTTASRTTTPQPAAGNTPKTTRR